MSSTNNSTSSATSATNSNKDSKKMKPFNKPNIVDFESLSLPSLKKYRSQFQIRVKPTVPKSELAAAVAEHFASIPDPEEGEVIDQFFKALQKNRTNASENEDNSATDEPPSSQPTTKKSAPSTPIINVKKRLTEVKVVEASPSAAPKNSLQSNSSKKISSAKRNSIPKVEKTQAGR